MKKIVHISSDEKGGAYKAATRINGLGIFSSNLITKTNLLSPNILLRTFEIIRNKIYSIIDCRILTNKSINKVFGPISIGMVNILNNKLFTENILHLHWASTGFISIKNIYKLSKKNQVIWHLHDIWLTQGIFHLKYTSPNKSLKLSRLLKTIDKLIIRQKNKYLSKINGIIICPSEWTYNIASNVNYLNTWKKVIIPNPIDVNVFKPITILEEDYTYYNLNKNKKIICFGAISGTSLPYKGFELLYDCLKKIKTLEVQAICFGGEKKVEKINNITINHIGFVNNENELNKIFNLSSLTIIPSLTETFGYVAAESMSSGTPPICFNVGGLPSLIENKLNGILIDPFDTTKMAFEIDFLLENDIELKRLSKNSRAKIIEYCSHTKIKEIYKDLYEKI